MKDVCLGETALIHGASSSTPVVFQMLALFRAADLHEERVRILRVLGCVKKPELIKRVLEFSLSDEVRSQV